MNINKLTSGVAINDIYIIKSHSYRQTKTGKTYLDAVLMDVSGTIPVKLWDVPETTPELSDGGFVRAEFSTEEYNGALQGKLISIARVAKEDVPEASLKRLVPCVQGDVEELFEELIAKLRALDAPNYRDFSVNVLETLKERFIRYPAAKGFHHAEIGGLLLHSLEVVKVIEALYEAMPCFDKALCMCAGALHDIGKLHEYTLGETGLVSDYSAKGQMLGHVFMGAAQIGASAKQFGVDDEYVMLLQHLILSHHGELEYGSPVRPETLEAYILHEADMISSRVHIYQEAVKDVEAGEFSQPVFALDKIRVYNPAYKAKGNTGE